MTLAWQTSLAAAAAGSRGSVKHGNAAIHNFALSRNRTLLQPTVSETPISWRLLLHWLLLAAALHCCVVGCLLRRPVATWQRGMHEERR